jgi:hypothetical protein
LKNPYLLLVLSFLILGTSINLKANNNFKNGYLILLNGDTVFGYILEQKSLKAAKRCVFKETAKGGKKVYIPGEISGYRFTDGKYFVSREIGSVSKKNVQTVFLEFFIKGIVNIYYMVDGQGEHFYIEKMPYGLYELSEPGKKQAGVQISPLLYKGKLRSLMTDCPELETEINNTELNYNSLVELARDYHNKVCTSESCIIYERHASPVIFRFGIIAGTSFNKYRFGSEFYTDYGQGFQLGGTMRIQNVIFSNDKIGFRVDICIEKDFNHNFKTSEYENQLIYNDIIYNIGRNETGSDPRFVYKTELPIDMYVVDLKIPIIFDYKYDFGKTSVYSGIGISNKLVLSSNQALEIPDFKIQYGRNFNTYSFGLTGKMGIEFNTTHTQYLSLNLLYEYFIDPMAVNKYLRLRENNFAVQLGYTF